MWHILAPDIPAAYLPTIFLLPFVTIFFHPYFIYALFGCTELGLELAIWNWLAQF